MKTPIYLDNHATTRVDPRVVAAMLALIYRFGPSRAKPQWRWITWGSAIAAVKMARRSTLLPKSDLLMAVKPHPNLLANPLRSHPGCSGRAIVHRPIFVRRLV